jgi:hypothetical protein
VEALFIVATEVDDDEAVVWLERFPRTLLGLLDRRLPHAVAPDSPGRRFVDRVVVTSPRR